ncbi:hypothetical protein Acr_10g0000860 [Actinidia rufa]|uniref:Uncharacterized protein n=1 Tax=Actinidia rufa TaxID=165716 RepID=A0A7J0F7U5_9ERIC|nr:hypothetical protein Acr_10g0000860 [Actinidia rufa]
MLHYRNAALGIRPFATTDDQSLQSELREQAAQQQGGPQNGPVGDDVFFTSCTEAVRMVSEANAEVCDMKERMVAMEQTCAPMAAQMTAMMSNMQKLLAGHGSPSEHLALDGYHFRQRSYCSWAVFGL